MQTPKFTLTNQQKVVRGIINGPETHCLVYGGARSGKTFLLVRNIVIRAIKAPNSRHLIARKHFNTVKRGIVQDTFPKVMRLCFPNIPYSINKQDGYAAFENGSEIWFGGLDDKDRLEKLLGTEYATVYLNESSEISFGAVKVIRTRLAQKCGLSLKEYIDLNPTTDKHWTYKEFIEGVSPEDSKPLDKSKRVFATINPEDNRENIAEEFFDTLDEMSIADRRRFKDGAYNKDVQGALWKRSYINPYKVSEHPQLQRVVVAVDPSGGADDVGIIAAGVDASGEYYVLSDATVNTASHDKWARNVVLLYEDLNSDRVVGESNFGGAMVEQNISLTAKDMWRDKLIRSQHISYKGVTASRGKVLRAEPISAMYERGKVHHVGEFKELEDEMCQFKSDWDRKKDGSPNRVDALVFALTELDTQKTNIPQIRRRI